MDRASETTMQTALLRSCSWWKRAAISLSSAAAERFRQRSKIQAKPGDANGSTVGRHRDWFVACCLHRFFGHCSIRCDGASRQVFGAGDIRGRQLRGSPCTPVQPLWTLDLHVDSNLKPVTCYRPNTKKRAMLAHWLCISTGLLQS